MFNITKTLIFNILKCIDFSFSCDGQLLHKTQCGCYGTCEDGGREGAKAF